MTQSGPPAAGDHPPRRVVVLGASNLVRGISTVVRISQQIWGEPLDFLAALGHGRSYGMKSRVLVRSLPGINCCGLWQALAERPTAPTAALITDIGNDILYGASVDQITGWVEQCLEKLRPLADRLVVTELPMASLTKLSPARFALARRLLFPSSKLQYDDARSRALQLNDRVKQLAARYGAALVQPRGQWFGVDPIHIKMRHWSAAWQEILALWSEGHHESFPRLKPSLSRWVLLRRLRPDRRWMFGIEQHRKQPAAKLKDGTLISFY